jgi:5-methylcytosine-specific restriction endonuclease McrA
MSPSTRARVRERAGHRCEYCLLQQDDSPLAALHVEHIIPKIHGCWLPAVGRRLALDLGPIIMRI